MTVSKLDQIYRSILLSKYFIKGWGSPENLKTLLKYRKVFSNRDTCIKLVGEEYPIEITKDELHGNVRTIEGQFTSPFDLYLPKLLPKETKTAYFQMLLPQHWRQNNYKPICVHFASTGDHYFWRRRSIMARPLLKEAGIGAIILENPFYGMRKPVYQKRSVLNNVSDIFVMGGCLILETIVLLRWCKRQGFGPLGVTGLSMGGHMASLAATNWPEPLVLVPCLSSSTASSVFTEGVMSRAINWSMLQSQFLENEEFRSEILRMIEIRESDAFQAGQQFVKNFPDSLEDLMETFTNEDNSTIPRKKDKSNGHSRGKPPPGNGKEEDNSKFMKKITQVFSSLGQEKTREYEAINFMRGIMDECTHLKNFSMPVDTSLVISVCARDDAYVPNTGDSGLCDIWPGAEVRFIDAGHVTGFLLYQDAFRKAIIEGFERCRNKYHR